MMQFALFNLEIEKVLNYVTPLGRSGPRDSVRHGVATTT